MKKLGFVSLALVLVIAAGCQKESAQAPELMVIADSVASADSVMIYYQSHGGGDRAVVFVHGWSCDGSHWARQVEAFADEFRVVTVDLAGHGKSGANRAEWTLGRFGDDVAAVVNALDVKEVILVGHSMGGPICVEAARRIPDRTVALVGADTFQRMSQKAPTDQVEEFLAPFRDSFVVSAQGFVREIFGPEADSVLVEEVVADMSAADSAIAMASFEAVFSHDVGAALTDMRKPIRAINSDRWPTDVEGNRSVAESFEVEIIKGIGHFPHLEAPLAFNLALRNILHEFWPPEEQT
ncbi:MAG: alpha/beta hydrolase [Candidatus Zixiibacteriota bacterium]|nr:MAG: alpha/beta hydrolase [candidate division Zixibacteria bacterium]